MCIVCVYRVSCYTRVICCEDLHSPAATWSMCIIMGAESFLISNVYRLNKQKKHNNINDFSYFKTC